MKKERRFWEGKMRRKNKRELGRKYQVRNILRDERTLVFTAALFTIAKIWEQPKRPSTDEWIKMCHSHTQTHTHRHTHTHTLEYYLAIKKIEIMLFAAIWVGLLLLSHLSRVRLCATPQTAAHQASPSLGFSRQEHWSGLPFPSPMHASEK